MSEENESSNWSDLSNQLLRLIDENNNSNEADISTFSDNQSIDISGSQQNNISDLDSEVTSYNSSESSNQYNKDDSQSLPRQQQYHSTMSSILGVAPLGQKRKEKDVLTLGISVAKEERGDLKLKDKKTYYKVKESCAKGIENKFTQLKPIDENSPVEHFESVYSVVSRFDDLQESLRTNDMIGVFTIASHYEPDGSGPTNISTPVDLFHDIKSTDMGVVKLANQYFYEYGQDYHGENVAWSGEKILNSCDESLRDKLIESTRGWSPLHKGGPTYLKLLMGLIVATSKKSLRSLLNKVSSLKLTDFNGEDVGRAVSFLRGASLILKDNDALPSDFLTLVLNIFCETTCTTFGSYVTTIEHNVDLEIMKFTTDDILRLFENKYIDMLGRTEWTPKSITAGQNSGFFTNGGTLNIMCFNCGGLGHAINDCKLPINQEHIDIRKNLVFGKKKRDGNSNKSGKKKSESSKKGSDSPSNSGGNNINNNNNVNPLTVPPKTGESNEKIINGTKLYWCTKCVKWTNHKTDAHLTDNDDNPQGHLANNDDEDDIGDDSGNSESGNFAKVHRFLTEASATNF